MLLYLLFMLSYMFVALCFIFFFKQKTAYEMRISDWSSDVCSSDLKRLEGPLKLGMDRILALPWAAQERRLVEKRLEAQGRLTCTVRRSAHLSRRSFVPLALG